jgi:hypothetical protein
LNCCRILSGNECGIVTDEAVKQVKNDNKNENYRKRKRVAIQVFWDVTTCRLVNCLLPLSSGCKQSKKGEKLFNCSVAKVFM